MKPSATMLLLVLPLICVPALAATEQQNKMTTCNKSAGDRKGDERKVFMKDCLSGKPQVSAAQKAQQDKMKACNAEAKDMKGDARKQFMSTCLKKG